MSALYQSKVAADASGRVQKQEMDSSSPSGNRPKAIKMTEDTQASKSDISQRSLPNKPLQRAGNRPQAQNANLPQNPTRPCLSPTPPSKEAASALYQQRQKCELKRLLKHTCPELSSLDGAVDEELADVWESESTAVDTGYQGEVLSRRWIFENCSRDSIGDPADSKTHLVGGVGQASGGEQKRAPPRAVQPTARPQPDGSSGTAPFQTECSLNQSQPHPLQPEVISGEQTDSSSVEENIVRADVRSTRMMFESQSIPKHTDSLENASPMKVVVTDEERGAVRKKMKVFNSNNQFSCNKTKTVLETQMAPLTVESAADTQQDDTEVYMGISKVKDVFERKSSGQTAFRFMGKENTGFAAGKIKNHKEGEKRQTAHIPLQNSSATQENISAQDELQKANVKDRAHLFESTPFHTINRREGADLVDVSMNERLKSLYHFNVIHANGTIVESFEAGMAKKATYNFTKGCCPEVLVEEIITGNIKNILLQILPRANLTSSVKFIKEDEQGNVDVKNVEVPIHQLPFTAHQDREYRTVNLVQVVEDLLNLDNSLQKGVIIQETLKKGAQACVYSLFSHEDTKGPQPQQEEQMETNSPEEAEEQVKGDVKGTIKSLLAGAQDKIVSGPRKVEESERGNVKLFRKCIEKGDLEYLKSLQKTPSEEELSSPSEDGKSHIVEETGVEIVPGNVRNIKNLFCQTGTHSPNYDHSKRADTFHKANNLVSNSAVTCPPNESTNKGPTDEINYLVQCEKISDVPLQDQPNISSTTCDEIQNEGIVPQADLVEGIEEIVPGNVRNIKNLFGLIEELSSSSEDGKSHIAEETGVEIVPGNVRNIKNLFCQTGTHSPNYDHSKRADTFHKANNSVSISTVKYPDESTNKGTTDEINYLVHCGKISDVPLQGQPDISSTTCDEIQTVPQADLVEAVQDDLSNLQAAILSLQQATMEAKALQHSIQEKQGAREKQKRISITERDNFTDQEPQQLDKSLPVSPANISVSLANHPVSPDSFPVSPVSFPVQDQYTATSVNNAEKLGPTEERQLTVEESKTLDHQAEDKWETHKSPEDSDMIMIKKGHLQKTIRSLQDSSSELPPQEQKEEIMKGNIHAALKSLEQSSFNVTQGDFTEAMIYRNAGKSHKQKKKAKNVEHVVKPTDKSVTLTNDSVLQPRQLDNSLPVSPANISVSLASHPVSPNSFSVSPVSFPVQDQYTATTANNAARLGPTEERQLTTEERKTLDNQAEDKWETRKSPEDSDMIMIKKGHLQKTIGSLQDSSSELPPQEEKEEIMKGNIHAALKSLEQSSVNVTQGDFTAAMIYRNAGKSHKQKNKAKNVEHVVKPTDESVTPTNDSITQPLQLDNSLPVSPANISVSIASHPVCPNSIPVSPVSFPLQDQYTATPANNAKRLGPTEERQLTTEESKTLDQQPENKWETHKSPEDSDMIMTKKGHLQKTIRSLQNSSSELPPQEEKEEIMKGNIHAALKSLEQSSVNVTQGDFTAAMIYKNAGKSHEQKKKAKNVEDVVKPTDESVTPTHDSVSSPKVSDPLDQQVPSLVSDRDPVVVAHSNQSKPEPPACINTKEQQTPTSKKSKKKSKKSAGPKPAIPPKPDHLKEKLVNKDEESVSLASKTTEKHDKNQTLLDTCKDLETEKNLQGEAPKFEPVSYKDALCKGMTNCPDSKDTAGLESTVTPDGQQCGNAEGKKSDSPEQHGLVQAAFEGQNKHHMTSNSQQDNSVSKKEAKEGSFEGLQGFSTVLPDSNEFVSGFQAELQKFGPPEQNVNKSRPVKPKRMKMAKDTAMNAKELSPPQQCNSNASECGPVSHPVTNDGQTPKESKVIMREKKVKKESEEERMQRLSVHRDEIMRGNVTTAMEIFDNLRKQEELKIILSKVEEIEEDTSDVDVKALRSIFENVPDWIRIKPKKLKPKQTKVDLPEEKCESPTKGPEMSSMELAFGDLEKASAEILNLKEQTLTKLLDIEEAIRKALLSVSTLKSESDIAGLSGLFKESMASAQASPSPSNIRTISIGSSKSQKAPGKKKKAAHANQSPKPPVVTEGRPVRELNVPATKHRAGSPSSPTFISIQSGVRKESDPASLSQSPAGTPQPHNPQSERFQSTKDLIVNSGRTEERMSGKRNECTYVTKALSVMDNPFDQHQFNVLEVQTLPKGERVTEKKTIKEDCEKTDCFGNRYFSSKTSTVVTTQPETSTSSRCKTVTSPTRSEVVTYPKANLPTFREDRPPV